jgi:hypothetical protein
MGSLIRKKISSPVNTLKSLFALGQRKTVPQRDATVMKSGSEKGGAYERKRRSSSLEIGTRQCIR